MNINELKKIIEQATQGNELPFDHFLNALFERLQPRLLSLTQSSQETEDIFITSMQKFWERFVINQEKLPLNIDGYIYIMCKNAWLMGKRNIPRTVILNESLKTENVYDDNDLDTETRIEELEQDWLQKKALYKALDQLSAKCKSLMEADMDKNTKLKDLQGEMGFTNYQALVQAKYNCKKRLIKKVYEILEELSAPKSNAKK